MRMIMYVTFQMERFNAALKAGDVGPTIKRILEDIKPEAAYFGEVRDGERGAVIVVDVATPADLPTVTEPWYLSFGAKVEVRAAMTPEDIAKPGLAEVVKNYG